MGSRGFSRTVPLGLILAGVVALPLSADAKLSRAGAPAVSFNAVGPAGMRIVGTTSDLSIDDDGQAVSVTVPLGNLTTGIALRDKHMKEKYLDTTKYPNATLKVARGALKIPAAGADTSADGQGTVTLHGVTKAVPFHYTAKREGGSLHVSGSLRVNMNDFGIEVPKYLGVTVKPDVDVSVKFDANEG